MFVSYNPFWFEMTQFILDFCINLHLCLSTSLVTFLFSPCTAMIQCFIIWQDKSPQILKVIVFSHLAPHCSCWVRSSRWLLEFFCPGSSIGICDRDYLSSATKLNTTEHPRTTYSVDSGIPFLSSSKLCGNENGF